MHDKLKPSYLRHTMEITAINPATGQPIKIYREMTPAETAAAVAQAHEAWKSWRTTLFGERSALMKKAAAILRQRKDELARLMATEMGKPLKQGAAQAQKVAWVCGDYADNAQSILQSQAAKSEPGRQCVGF